MRNIIEMVYTGENYCIFPGNPLTVADDFEKIFKRIAYTSERGIDWEAEQIAERVGNLIIRGVKISVDPWLFKRYKETI